MVGQRHTTGYHPDYEKILEYVVDIDPLTHDDIYFYCEGGHSYSADNYLIEEWTLEVNETVVNRRFTLKFRDVEDRNRRAGLIISRSVRDSMYYKTKKYLEKLD